MTRPKNDITTVLEQRGGVVTIRVKVVPGASRTEVVGVLGDRLKIAVATPPQGGKANKAVCQLIAETLGVGSGQVHVLTGNSQPQKTVAIAGVSADHVAERLRAALDRS